MKQLKNCAIAAIILLCAVITACDSPLQKLESSSSGGGGSPNPSSPQGPQPQTPQPPKGPQPPAAPAAPTVVEAEEQLTVTWSAVSGADSYNVFYSDSADSGTSQQSGGDISATSYVITGLTNDTPYNVWVKAKNSAGTSGFSPSGTGTPVAALAAPNAPAAPRITSVTHITQQLPIEWNPVSGAVEYEVWYRDNTDDSSGAAQFNPGAIADTYTTITGLSNNRVYYIWIKAKNSLGASGFSPSASGNTLAAPLNNANYKVEAGIKQLEVQLPRLITAGAAVTAYEFWYGTEDDPAKAVKAGEVPHPSTGQVPFTITGLQDLTTYYVWGKNKNATGVSDFSVSKNAATLNAIPSAPGAPTVTPQNNLLAVSWTPVTGAASYEVWYKQTTADDPSGATKFNGAGTITGTFVSITGLTGGQQYYVWVKAVNSAGTSGFSPGTSGTPTSPTPPPAAPTISSVSAGNASLTVTWSAVSGAASYEVYYRQGTNDSSGAQKYSETAGLSAQITGLTNGSLYYVWVKAKSAAGTSAFSAPSSGTPAAPGGLIPINNAVDMAKIGNDGGFPLTGKYELKDNITLSNWTPIGTSTNPFTGSFDGKGKTIILDSFDSTVVSSSTYLGIFGYVEGASASAKAELSNITINSSVNQSSAMASGQVIGLLVGWAKNTVINNISLSGSFGFDSAKTLYLGGVAGVLTEGATLKNSSSAMTMNITPGFGAATGIPVSGNPYNYIGGFAGMLYQGGGIERCQNTANVTATSAVTGSQVFVGGVAGGGYYSMSTDYHGYIADSSSTGNITGSAMGFWTFTGGIAGSMAGDGGNMANDANTSRIVRCWASGTISDKTTSSSFPYIGGIVAYNYYGALVSQCYFTGTVDAKSATYSGGIAGYNSQTTDHNSRIEDCWSSGTVTNGSGIVGQSQVNAYVRRCYSRSAVTGSGIAGSSYNTSSGISACVALNASVGGKRVCGSATGLSNNMGRTGLGTSPVNNANGVDGANCDPQPIQSVYQGLGWNFSTVWKMGGDGYPRLQWEP